ncbi:polysaccharide deacetylase family protein [Paenibacillus sp. M1]|uniref:Polysaccharide deacetylase family protein n=1 Tax=Paenibacillus haidiansis TaxID=1574488 RepID=A0ABU7VNG8_9BACL
MVNRKRNPALNVRRKNRIKVEKTILQALILLVLGALLINALFHIQRYREPDKSEWTARQQGFIAISYFGVGRSGSAKLVAKRQLDEQLRALHDLGYVTISQQDIIDYYTKGKPLPDKALFLSFEDGRNDSALFAQPLLEKYNYKATFLSYADKMGNSERKFLQPKEMLRMTKTGFWELGTNGYRLSYINIFDKEGRFLGQKAEKELTDKSQIEYYNHYLMDFIRDENMIPLEDRDEMEARIKGDYDAMQDIYTETLGYVPSVYMIMHANALGEGMNRLVTEANNDNIGKLFRIHFNREGKALNSPDESILDLTRVQPAPYWSTNHLLMKIAKDTGEPVRFVQGNEREAEQWNLEAGAAEFKDNEIILTSSPGESGQLILKGSESTRDVTVKAEALGNVVGKQSIYLRYDRERDSFVRLILENNDIRLEQKKPGQTEELLFSRELDPVTWSPDDLAFDKASVYTKAQTAAGTASGEDEYPINIGGNRSIELAINGSTLKLTVDKQVLLAGMKIDESIAAGGVAFASEYNEHNKKDDIYDAVFKNVEILDTDDASGKESHLFSNRSAGFKGLIAKAREAVNNAVDWAIETF